MVKNICFYLLEIHENYILYILDTNSFHDKFIANIYLWDYGLPFYFLNDVFQSVNTFHFDKVQFINFVFHVLYFLCSKKPLPTPKSQDLLLLDMLKFYVLHIGHASFWVNICVWHEVNVSTDCFYIRISTSSSILY